MQVEDSAVQLVLLPALGRRPDGGADLVEEGAEAFFEFAVSGHDEFFVEVVAVDVDRRAGVDLPAHQDDAVFECHGEGDVVVAENVEDALGDDVVLRLEI